MIDIETLRKDPEVFFIYRIDNTIFGLEDEEKYLIVADKDIVDSQCVTYSLVKWFMMIENCELLPWICACLNKKYVIKEHVKLLMTTDVVKLYDNWHKQLNGEKDLSLLIKALLTEQIVMNHKVKNFAAIGDHCKKAMKGEEDYRKELYQCTKTLDKLCLDAWRASKKAELDKRIKEGKLKPVRHGNLDN